MVLHDNPHLMFTFDGGQARDRQIRMYEAGTALIGIDRLLTTGLQHIAAGKVIAPRAPQPFIIQTSAPGDGSIEIPVWLTATMVVALPLVEALCIEGASRVLWLWTSAVLTRMAGRERESTDYAKDLIDFLRTVEDHRHAEQTQRHMENMAWTKLVHPAARVMEPVGRSCHTVTITGEDEATIEFDSYDADAIRSNATDWIDPMEEITLTIDGFTLHNRQLRVKDPESPSRYVPAHVRDPEFNITPNVYTETASRRGDLRVMARTARNKANGSIRAFFILNALHKDG